jgi:hypothetical protein
VTARRCLGAVAAGVVVATLAAVPAAAATLQDSGWWWRANPGQSSVTPGGLPQVGLPAGAPETPPPPDAPEGGLVVERAPDGDAAVAAVRFGSVGEGAGVVLELRASSAQGVPELLACRSGSAWTGADAGRWDSRPHAACDADGGGASVPGEQGEEGLWTFAVAALVGEGGDLDLVIVPAPAENGAAVPFRVVFEPVTGSSLQSGFGDGAGFDGSGFDADAAFSSGFGDATAGMPSSGTTDFDLGAGPSLPDLDTPSAGAEVGAPASGAPQPTGPLATTAPFVPDDGAATTAAIAVLALGTAAMYAAVRRPMPVLQSLVPLRTGRGRPSAEPPVHVGGLGRFARPRSRAPIRLG